MSFMKLELIFVLMRIDARYYKLHTIGILKAFISTIAEIFSSQNGLMILISSCCFLKG